jgi:transcription elongation factor GreB
VSKAFTREPDDEVPPPAPRRRGVPIPEGVPNYVTADGARALRAELDQLTQGPRDPDAEARIRELTEHLACAEVAAPPAGDDAGFGSIVTVEDEDGARTDYHLVGAIEADPRAGRISWQAPLARALHGARVGDVVALPRGREVEVVAIRRG